MGKSQPRVSDEARRDAADRYLAALRRIGADQEVIDAAEAAAAELIDWTEGARHE